MQENTKRERFYDLLHEIFTGVKVEGEGGYINLLKIKSRYYSLVLAQFEEEVATNKTIDISFREEFFDKLYTFFYRYFSQSGSIYFCHTPYGQKIYEQIYTDNKDVILFWKTHMLYYVKSEILYRNIDITVVSKSQEYYFYFDVSNLDHKKNNEKKALVYSFQQLKNNKLDAYEKSVCVLEVNYSKNGSKTKLKELAKHAKLDEDLVQKACDTFKKQAEVDYFINKNAREFLEEQLNIYLHQYLLHEENKFLQKRLTQLKTLQEFALKLIDFIAQFEDELARVWNKPKFVIDSNYVITLDKLSNSLLQKIAKHQNLPQQITEWQDLAMTDKEFDFTSVLDSTTSKKYQYLPLDTKYFKDLQLEILALFANLDEALDGKLIHSENYQALNSLKAKYQNKVQCIYIDPPFNLESNGDYYFKVNYKDANWATMLENRIRLAHSLLADTGSIFVRCDYHGNFIVRCLLDEIFGKTNFRNEIVVNRTQEFFKSPGKTPKKYMWDTDSVFLFSKSYNNKFIQVLISRKQNVWFMPFLPSENKPENDFRIVFEQKIYSPKGRKWGIEQKNIDELLKKDRIRKNQNDQIEYSPEFIKIKNNWTDIAGYQRSWQFPTENSEKLVDRVIQTASQNDDLVLDFFMGSGTTQAVAHKLGRKWLGVEMGEQFFNTVLPRLKQVLFGEISGISKELQKAGNFRQGGFFQYYALEQYEQTLAKMQYQDYPQKTLFTKHRQTYEQYIFFADKKLADVLQTQKTQPNIDLDFSRLYEKIDLAETLSNRYGLPIKQITKDEVVLQEGKNDKTIKINIAVMSDQQKLELVAHLKPLLWWGA